MQKNLFLFYILAISCSSPAAQKEDRLGTKEKSSAFVTHFAINAFSGSVAMTVYSPFHYLQNRIIQKAPIDPKIYFWFKGAPSLIIGKAPTTAVKMFLYEILETFFQGQSNRQLSPSTKIYIASFAGGVSGIINNFTHLVALHQENYRKPFKQTTQELSAISHNIISRGLGTTILREAIFTITYLAFLKDIKKFFYQTTSNNAAAFMCSTLCSGGIVASTTQPLMVIATKLYADMKKKEYKNGLDALLKIYKEGGVKAFYKGSLYRSMGIIAALSTLDLITSFFK